MRTHIYRRVGYWYVIAAPRVLAWVVGSALAFLSAEAIAETSIPMPPITQAVDGNSIDQLTAISRFSLPTFSIGNGEGALSRSYSFSYSSLSDNNGGLLYFYNLPGTGVQTAGKFSYGGVSVDFNRPLSSDVPIQNACNLTTSGFVMEPFYDSALLPIVNGECTYKDRKVIFSNTATGASSYNDQFALQKYTAIDENGIQAFYSRSLIGEVGGVSKNKRRFV